MGFGLVSNAVGTLLLLTFMVVVPFFISIAVQLVSQRNKNNRSPRLTVDARVVAKRIHVGRHHHANADGAIGAHGYSSTSSTFYLATFEVDSGDRMEFTVSGGEYGLLAEGDCGRLSFQGTRYLGFERETY